MVVVIWERERERERERGSGNLCDLRWRPPCPQVLLAGDGLLVTSDSDRESGASCFSLPATPPRLRARNHPRTVDHGKECLRDNEAATARSRQRKWRRGRMIISGTDCCLTIRNKSQEEVCTMMESAKVERERERERVEGVGSTRALREKGNRKFEGFFGLFIIK
ncbi:hypothetical protein TIFTF001_004228 [Ficus carica]|uniref:Uncharacterized protein n=1 Tax=Ficus carica TaxID=3494 RepID=A0AA87ZH50_FICCA|nr:hypothetical protein TIFTF001_004228 [Ficus carica]